MRTAQEKLPTVLVFAGLDPTGGAGLEADIESIASMGGHAMPVITTIAVQDTEDVKRCEPIDAMSVVEQARAVLEDIEVGAFKIGLTGSVAVIEAVHTILSDYPEVPVVLDPVFASGAGTPLADDEQLDAMVTLLFPLTTLLTPNSVEARALTPEADSLNASAQQLLSYGSDFVLVTGTHEPTPRVTHHLYGDRRLLKSFDYDRLPATYHGSGCTLASAAAALLAHGFDPVAAVNEALQYTLESLKHGYRLGNGQLVPDRLYWARDRSER